MIEEVQANKDIILFIDELHTLMGAGSAGGDGGMDAAQLLKPALARGEMQCIGATTVEEYRRCGVCACVCVFVSSELP